MRKITLFELAWVSLNFCLQAPEVWFFCLHRVNFHLWPRPGSNLSNDSRDKSVTMGKTIGVRLPAGEMLLPSIRPATGAQAMGSGRWFTDVKKLWCKIASRCKSYALSIYVVVLLYDSQNKQHSWLVFEDTVWFLCYRKCLNYLQGFKVRLNTSTSSLYTTEKLLHCHREKNSYSIELHKNSCYLCCDVIQRHHVLRVLCVELVLAVLGAPSSLSV
jgi:hypothetical protein